MKKEITRTLLAGSLSLVGCIGGADSESMPVVDRSTDAVGSSGLLYRGVNLAGAEFGIDPWGNGNGSYVYPDPSYAGGYASADYFVQKGMNTFRLPFRWERLQPTRGQPFDGGELDKLRSTVNRLTGKGAYVLIDPHNYARYRAGVVGAAVSNTDFADFWGRLAQEFGKNGKVLFGLMNEPHDISTEQWVGAANAAISAIRSAGAGNLILVPGNGWTGAHTWGESWYGTSNAQALLAIQDPWNKVAFEAHQYLDDDSSGTKASCAGPNVGSQRMQPFTDWLRQNGKKGFLGEFGGGPDGTCASAIGDIVSHLEQNQDVYLGWTYWAAGPWWGNYFTSLEPSNGDRPQMTALLPHLGAPSSGGGGTCADTPPAGGFTCAQQAGWGKCGEAWMQGYCDQTCGRCSQPSSCADTVPPGGYTCTQQAGWGKCGEPWMQGYCSQTCGRCQ